MLVNHAGVCGTTPVDFCKNKKIKFTKCLSKNQCYSLHSFFKSYLFFFVPHLF